MHDLFPVTPDLWDNSHQNSRLDIQKSITFENPSLKQSVAAVFPLLTAAK